MEELMEKYVYFLNTNRSLRNGQALMLALFETNTELYNDITGSPVDCFYDDKKMSSCIAYIEENV